MEPGAWRYGQSDGDGSWPERAGNSHGVTRGRHGASEEEEPDRWSAWPGGSPREPEPPAEEPAPGWGSPGSWSVPAPRSPADPPSDSWYGQPYSFGQPAPAAREYPPPPEPAPPEPDLSPVIREAPPANAARRGVDTWARPAARRITLSLIHI